MQTTLKDYITMVLTKYVYRYQVALLVTVIMDLQP